MGPVRVIWKADGRTESIDTTIRVLSIDEDCVLEVLFRPGISFWERVKQAYWWVCRGQNVLLSVIPLSVEDSRRFDEDCGKG
jgi:hypothetical protein